MLTYRSAEEMSNCQLKMAEFFPKQRAGLRDNFETGSYNLIVPRVLREEHFLVPDLVHGHFDASSNPGYSPESDAVLRNLGDDRLAAMEAYGITQQVISASMPGANHLGW